MVRTILLLFCCAAAAGADYEETERRLKRAGVEPALRERIHEAIDRGARWLAGRQAKDGSFSVQDGMSALCALALQHSPGPEARAATAKSLAFLVPRGNDLRQSLYGSVYGGGVAAMFLFAQGGHEKILRHLGAALAYGEHESGFWGYGTRQRKGRGAGNLSTSQFAVLGLWAAGRAGYQAKREMWERHVAHLIGSQVIDGSFGYGGRSNSYPTGTFMGFANLLLAVQAIGEESPPAARARARAEVVLGRDVRAVLAGFRRGFRDYYALYALEKAAVFSDREEIDGIAWYVEGARLLLEAQRKDGRWSGNGYRYWLYGWRAGGPGRDAAITRGADTTLEATAFALLFLLRSWETFHPVTPRSVHHAPTTPGAAPAKEEAEPVQPPAPRVPLGLARALLDELALRLKDKRADPGQLAAAVDRVGDAYRRLEDADGAEAWRRRAERALLAALASRRVDKARRANRYEPVNLAAARGLAHTDARVVPGMRRVVDEVYAEARGYAVGEALWDAVFDALVGFGGEATLRWMLEHHFVATGGAKEAGRCAAALRAARRYRGVPAALRHEIVKRLVRAYAPVERAASKYNTDAPSTAGTWRRIGPAAIVAVQHFASTLDGLAPASRAPIGGWIFTMREFEQWWRDHKNLNGSPWR